MFGTILSTITGILDKRFTLNSLLPTFLAGLGLVVVYETTGEGLGVGVDRFTGLDGTTQWIVAIVAVSAVTLIAVGLARWKPWGPQLMTWFDEQRVQRRTEDPFALGYGTRPRDWLPAAPTALGNIGVLTSEYAQWTYGMEFDTVWPRMLAITPDDAKVSITAAESGMEQAINLSALSILFALAAEVIAVSHEAAAIVVVGLPVLALFAAYLFYRSSLTSARLWSESVRTVLDLHRGKLLEALRVPQPSSSAEERDAWDRVSRRLRAADERPYAIDTATG